MNYVLKTCFVALLVLLFRDLTVDSAPQEKVTGLLSEKQTETTTTAEPTLRPIKYCDPTLFCGWAVYKQFTREIIYFLKNPCECPENEHCVRVGDDPDASAYVYKCRVKRTTAPPQTTQFLTPQKHEQKKKVYNDNCLTSGVILFDTFGIPIRNFTFFPRDVKAYPAEGQTLDRSCTETRLACGWLIYKQFTKYYDYHIKNTCYCTKDEICKYDNDDYSNKYTYKCVNRRDIAGLRPAFPILL